MPTKPRKNKFLLPPRNPDLKTICVQLEIPNTDIDIENFFGAIHELCEARSYMDDPIIKAKTVVQAWRTAEQTITFSCQDKQELFSALEGDMPFFREVCENGKCYLEYQCCPGEWVRLANADQLTPPGQPGAGSPQPGPNGGSAEYCVRLDANGVIYLPTLVSTGDVISITSASGSGSDGNLATWYCPTGQNFFGGACFDPTHTVPGDPVNTDAHMRIIVNVAGTYHAFDGTNNFTVPGGITNGQAFIQVNDDPISNNQGSYDVCVTVVNNQLANWSVDLDLTSSTHGLVATDFTPFERPSTTVWSPGVGFVATGGGDGDYTIGAVLLPLAGFTGFIDQAILTVSTRSNSGANQYCQWRIGGTVVSPTTEYDSTTVTSTDAPIDQAITHSVAFSTPQWMSFAAFQASHPPLGDVVLSRLRLTGRGQNPFA